MRISLHGSFTIDMTLKFLLHFFQKAIKHNIKKYRPIFAIVTVGDIDLNLRKSILKRLFFYKENMVIPHKMGIMLKHRVLISSIGL